MSASVILLNIVPLALPNASIITANDINDHGQIVGQFDDAQGAGHGFVCEDGSFCQLDYPDASSTNVLGINNLGQMVGMFGTLTATSGFLYDRGTFSPPLAFPGSSNLTIANGINDRGEIVGVYQSAAPGEHSFLLKANKYSTLIFPGSRETAAEDINNSGEVVGGFPDAHGTHGFVYLENVGVFTTALSASGGTVTALRGVNNGGQIVGGWFDNQGNEHPFLYMAGAIHPIVIPGATSASVNGINDRGQVVGNYQAGNVSQSFVAAIR